MVVSDIGVHDSASALPKIAITGASGFVGWHLRCYLQAHNYPSPVLIKIRQDSSVQDLVTQLEDVDAVVHLAGVNRSENESDFWDANAGSMLKLVFALDSLKRQPVVVYGNSVRARSRDDIFAKTKLAGLSTAREWSVRHHAVLVDVLMPNLFGEHGLPNYNSVVATFCNELAKGSAPVVHDDRELQLLHVQDACAILAKACNSSTSSSIQPTGRNVFISEVLRLLSSIAENYGNGYLPDLSDEFTRSLFNTYRSYTFPDHWPKHPMLHADERGQLFEGVRAGGGEAQIFCSTTRPGMSRGNHFHLTKTERFMVLQGLAVIRLRRLFTDDVVEFEVDGSEPVFVDMPTMWTHSITNVGQTDLLTLFYADDLYNPDDPDTYWIDV
jgi:UDP-2-acetamido-2,6-beta-L-arabino-hexul-4-ose reductase